MSRNQKQREETLEPEVLFNSIMNSAPFGIIVLEPDGAVHSLNLNAKNLLMLPISHEKPSGMHITEGMKHLPRLAEELSRYIQKPLPAHSFESEQINERYLEITARHIQDGIIVIISDITELKELESSSVQAIISGQEKERRRLAREIHDGIAPLLSSAKLELDLFLEDLRESGQDIKNGKLLNIRNTIDALSADLRNLSHMLMPRLLEEFGLLSAFQNMVTRTKNTTESQIELISNLYPQERLDKEIELNLYRCGQELLNNAIRHAEADKITVQLIKHEASIILMVEDDGKGFEPDRVKTDKEGGIGLINVETRARTLNGECIFESVEGRGTLISIELPFK